MVAGGREALVESAEEGQSAPPKKARKAGRSSGDKSNHTCYTCFGKINILNVPIVNSSVFRGQAHVLLLP